MDLKSLQKIQLDQDLTRYKSEIVAGVMVLIFIFMVRGNIAGFSSASAQLEAQKKQASLSQNAAQRWTMSNKKYLDLKQETFFSTVLSFKRVLEDKGQELGLVINDIRPSVEDRSDYKVARISMNGVSTYKSIVEYVRFLESRAVVVEMLKVSSVENASDKKFEITCKGFVRED